MKIFQKTKKKPPSKVIVGGKGTSKKKAKKSFLKIGYFSVLALLLFSAVGDVGYNYLQANQLKAHAENWQVLKLGPGSRNLLGNPIGNYIGPYSTAGFKVSACKQTVATPFGQSWKVRVVMIRPTNISKDSGSMHLNAVSRENTTDDIAQSESSSWWLGTVANAEIIVVKNNFPLASFNVSYQGYYFGNVILVSTYSYNVAYLTNC